MCNWEIVILIPQRTILHPHWEGSDFSRSSPTLKCCSVGSHRTQPEVKSLWLVFILQNYTHLKLLKAANSDFWAQVQGFWFLRSGGAEILHFWRATFFFFSFSSLLLFVLLFWYNIQSWSELTPCFVLRNQSWWDQGSIWNLEMEPRSTTMQGKCPTPCTIILALCFWILFSGSGYYM